MKAIEQYFPMVRLIIVMVKLILGIVSIVSIESIVGILSSAQYWKYCIPCPVLCKANKKRKKNISYNMALFLWHCLIVYRPVTK